MKNNKSIINNSLEDRGPELKREEAGATAGDEGPNFLIQVLCWFKGGAQDPSTKIGVNQSTRLLAIQRQYVCLQGFLTHQRSKIIIWVVHVVLHCLP